MTRGHYKIGITPGDPKGIGPEVVAKAIADPNIRDRASFEIFGDLEMALRAPFSDLEAAKFTYESLRRATHAARSAQIDALVTAPINKARLKLVDPGFVDHTSFFEKACERKAVAFFDCGTQPLRVSLVTRHIPFRQISEILSATDILHTIRLTAEGLRSYFQIASPHLGVCGLNPHAGEQGTLGLEEKKIIEPAILQARKEGIQVFGPCPPDTLFWQARQKKYDAVIALYHDQGLIPLKTLDFGQSVQITLGLPFLRTSVDHGTAEALARQDKADATSMKRTIELTLRLLQNRKNPS